MYRIGIIGGSGLYQIEGLKILKRISLTTPFGCPSDKFVLGLFEDREVVFLPRHGLGHKILPGEINYRANIFGMKKLKVERIISVSACGSLKKEIKPLDFILPDQFVDRTNSARKMTFFGEGLVAHVSMAWPVCLDLAKRIHNIVKNMGINIHLGGTYLNMEGPAFSTRAESELYRRWNMDIIGMTNIAEARLAREAEICYVTLASVTDYDCWYEASEPVTNEMVRKNFAKNIENAKRIIQAVVRLLPQEKRCECAWSLKFAIMTDKRYIPGKTKKNLKIIIGKYLK